MVELKIETKIYQNGNPISTEMMIVEDTSITKIKSTFYKAVCDVHTATCEFLKTLSD